MDNDNNTPATMGPLEPSKENPPTEIDRTNNVVQKELAMNKAGVTRYKYLLVIAEALEAVKVGDVIDSQGNVKRELIPDVRRREWGAEMAAKLKGDMIEHKEITHEVGDRTLERFKTLSVGELKEKARKILEVKAVVQNVERVVAIEEIDDE